jgi:Zn-dependent peptidase ImmA (M78 family)
VLDQEEDAPIGNLTLALERAGVVVVPIIGLEGIDGLSSWVEVGDQRIPVIGLDPLVPGDRFRLTLLHELGHLAFHAKPGETTENEANSFARKVLIPDHHLEQLFMGRTPTLRDFVALKGRWGISVAALIYGAHHDLGLMDDQRFRSLQIQMAPWRRNEPQRFEPVPGRLLPTLVDRAGGSTAVGERFGIAARHVDLTVRWSHLRAV